MTAAARLATLHRLAAWVAVEPRVFVKLYTLDGYVKLWAQPGYRVRSDFKRAAPIGAARKAVA